MLGVRRITFRPLTSCWSSSKFHLRRQSWSRGRPPAIFFDPNTANQQQQQQQQFLLCHTNDVRWLATKRQKRTAAAASSSSSSTSGHVSAAAVRSTNTENQPASGGDSTLSANTAAAVNRLPRADDDDNDIKTTTTTTTTTTKNESDGRVFQSHDQIFAKRNANRAAGPSPAVLWLPPPPLGTGTSEAQAASNNQLLFSSNNLFEFQDHYKQLYSPDLHLASAPTDWTAGGYEAATPLWHDLAALIGVSGRPISVADYMRLCLTHPVHGYYTRANNTNAAASASSAGAGGTRKLLEDDFDHDEWDDESNNKNDANNGGGDDDDGLIIGPRGDFVTAPEMTQIFGECIAVWFMTVWQQKQQQEEEQRQRQHADDSTSSSSNSNKTTAADKEGSTSTSAWQWLEFGPGTGTLMADLTRFCFYSSDTIRNTFGGSNCRAIHFIEQSPRLRNVQKETLEREVHKHASSFVPPGGKTKKQRFVEFEFHDESESSSSSIRSSSKKFQATTLIDSNDGNIDDKDIVRLPVYWHDSLAHFQAWQEKNQSYLPTHVVCQEFLDALPIYAFEKTAKEGWRERLVDIALREDMLDSMNDDDDDTSSAKEDGNSNTSKNQQQQSPNTKAADSKICAIKKPRLRIVLAPEVTPAARTLLGVQELKDEGSNSIIASLPCEGEHPAPVGSVIEVNPEAILLVQDLARLIDRQGGAAIIIDYGSEQGSRDSIRAFSRHEQVHFLSQPGLVDITADVDFAPLKHAVNYGNLDNKSAAKTTTRAFGPVTQGNFLMAMGANDRAVHLIENDNTTEEEAENIYQALVRLCSPEEMGERFKVMALVDPSTFENNNNNNSGSFQQPPGF